MSERCFSTSEAFKPCRFIDPDTGEIQESPFTVAVLGLQNELLGVGTVIGALDGGKWDEMPVISIEDKDGFVELLGDECWWSCPVDEETTRLLASRGAGVLMVSASTYLENQNL